MLERAAADADGLRGHVQQVMLMMLVVLWHVWQLMLMMLAVLGPYVERAALMLMMVVVLGLVWHV